MLNYWKADAYRIVRSLSFWVMTLLSIVVYIAGVFMVSGPHYSVDSHGSIIAVVGTMAAIFTGLGIYNTLYSQDIKAGAMRVAIGRGTGRSRIVVAKFIETIVVTVLAGAVLYCALMYLPLIFGIGTADSLTRITLIVVLQFALETIMFSSLASIVSMARQESVTATVIYVLLAVGVFDQILSLVLSTEFVTNLIGDITGYLPQTLSMTLGSQFSGSAAVSVTSVIVYLGYMVVSLLLSSWVFSKKELDF